MQRKRGFLFLLLALGCGIGAALAARNYVQSTSDEMRRLQLTEVVVADIDLPVGTALARGHVHHVSWPAKHVPPGALRNEQDAYERVLRRPLVAGEPVLDSALHPKGFEGGLGAVIEGNRRAVSVKVDKVVGVAGFIKPGSRVDVIATLRKVDESNQVPFSNVVLQDVQVLAIDQKMEEAKDGDPEIVSVVTLAVDAIESQKLIYAAHEGKLQLAMRRPGDKEIVQTRAIGVRDLEGKKPTPEAVRRSTVQVVRGGTVTATPFSSN